MINRPLRIGIVCPYSWDVPGGVQNHIRDLAEFLIANGHYVEVLAPATESEDLPSYIVSAGRAVSIPYNGAVARVLFGVGANSRVRNWINEGNFDLLHLHEPAIPSLALLACWAGEGAMVGTFHAAAKYQKAIVAIGPILEPVIEKLSARIAVSEAARLTLTAHLETDAIVSPNGIYADNYRNGTPKAEWQGSTIGFLGRFEEDRKGLPVLLDALPIIARFVPIVRTFAPFVAGIGEMSYSKFIRFNIIGGIAWVIGLTLMGYFFGNLEFVQKNFETVIFGIIGLSSLPMIIEVIRAKFKKS